MINGKLLKELREARGLSQTELARKVGVHISTIIRAENGQKQMHLSHFARLCEVLGADANPLLGMDTNELIRRQARLAAYQELGKKLQELTHA